MTLICKKRVKKNKIQLEAKEVDYIYEKNKNKNT